MGTRVSEITIVFNTMSFDPPHVRFSCVPFGKQDITEGSINQASLDQLRDAAMKIRQDIDKTWQNSGRVI